MRVTSKGQVTIPIDIRERCGIGPNTEVRFAVENGRVIIEPQTGTGGRGEEAVQRLRKARLRTRLSTDQLLALTRGDEP